VFGEDFCCAAEPPEQQILAILKVVANDACRPPRSLCNSPDRGSGHSEFRYDVEKRIADLSAPIIMIHDPGHSKVAPISSSQPND
jgi:hypothetical protein